LSKIISDLNIAVVVLNYENYHETIECVNSILEQTYRQFNIIIVENGSQNESFSILNDLFENNPFIKILKNEINLGFAKGNNVGIKYVREELKVDFIFILNSDTVLNKSLFEEVRHLNIEKKVAVFSPTVMNELHEIQDPTIQLNDIRRFTIGSILYLNFSFIRSLPFFRFFYKKYSNFKKRIVINNRQEVGNIQFKHSIHGSAFFLTPLFFKYYSNPYPKTFLYWEEINLIWYLHKVGLKSSVYPTSPVLHKESKSVDLEANIESISFWKMKKSHDSFFKSVPMFFSTYKNIIKRYN